MGRIHRIGSEHDVVTFIDLITNDTIDEAVQKTQQNKKDLGDGLVEKSDEEMEAMAILMKELKED